MHSIFRKVVVVAALYVTVGCTTSHVPETRPIAPPPAPSAAAQPVPALPPAAPAVVAPQLAPGAVPHIALLLPLKSDSAYLAKAAEAVQGGFFAANGVHPGSLPVRVYACADEKKEIVALYQQAVVNGAQAVVGPLTHDGVAALAAQGSISVPTLALNGIEGAKIADKLYFFGLTLEGEARQVARLAAAEDLHTANIVSTDTPLSKRLVQAFTEEWKKQGGEVVMVKTFTGDTSIFADLAVEPGSMVFVAASADKARLFRPFLHAALPVYATSQIFNGNASANQIVNYDLRDIHFVDMPWLLQPDRPAVMIYPRANPPLDVDMERFYALGIDAYRLLQLVANNRTANFRLEGVTGTIRLGANHQFEREAVAAQFRQGLGLTPEGFAAMNAAKASGGEASATGPAKSQ